jgi:hypothetical protein
MVRSETKPRLTGACDDDNDDDDDDDMMTMMIIKPVWSSWVVGTLFRSVRHVSTC